jgi:hypothetical protein
MIGRADIEGSKSNVAMNAWLPQASYPCGNFSDTPSWTNRRHKGSIGHVFTVCIRTENENQASISPFGLHKISVLSELTLGHLRYHLTDVPTQPNSPPDYVPQTDQKLKPEALNPKLKHMQAAGWQNKQNGIKSSGISRSPKRPLMLHLLSHVAKSD